MKTIGITGGIGPEYYRLIVSSYLSQEKMGNYPSIIINSINMKRMLDLIGANKLDDVTEYLVNEVDKVAAAGSDFALLASNTPHVVFDQIEKASSLPLISIVEAACKKAVQTGLKRVGLFGTKFTMQSGFYEDVFSRHGIHVVTPDTTNQEYIHDKYMGELVNGIIHDETRSELLKITYRFKERHKIEALILGGTELPLIFREGRS